ncbi:MAG: NAD(P)/FAD-dependent oxidoreductase [Ginsengibacter sp.]
MEVIIIGAGAAGLMAAKKLSAKGINTLILEARDRPGGRIHTIENLFTSTCEAGAEFIHGNLLLTKSLLKEAGLKATKVEGEICRIKNGYLKEENDFVAGWDILIRRLKELKTDITISKFLEVYIPEEKYADVKDSFKKYVQGYNAADIKDASSFSIREEMENEDDDQFRINKGYGALINFLAEESKKNGCILKTAAVVKQINWQKNTVDVITHDKTYNAQKVIITIPIGVLQAAENEEGAIKFYPEIIEQQSAINNIGYGGVIKILLEFNEAFWLEKQFLKERNINKPSFFFADTFIPTWWTQVPDEKPLLVGWLAGPDANKYSNFNEDEFLEKSIISLTEILKVSRKYLYKKLKTYKVYNWAHDPFCRGAYSYSTVATKRAVKILKKPIANTLYFAGEALVKNSTGTVDAALQSGEEVAKKVLEGLI